MAGKSGKKKMDAGSGRIELQAEVPGPPVANLPDLHSSFYVSPASSILFFQQEPCAPVKKAEVRSIRVTISN